MNNSKPQPCNIATAGADIAARPFWWLSAPDYVPNGRYRAPALAQGSVWPPPRSRPSKYSRMGAGSRFPALGALLCSYLPIGGGGPGPAMRTPQNEIRDPERTPAGRAPAIRDLRMGCLAQLRTAPKSIYHSELTNSQFWVRVKTTVVRCAAQQAELLPGAR